MRIRTADLLLTMETLYLLSYRGTPAPCPRGGTGDQRYTDGPAESELEPFADGDTAP